MTVAALKYTHAPLDEQLAKQGVRQFELDTQYDADTGEFVVFHIIIIDEVTNCRRFVDCLGALAGWSKKNPAHHPIFVQVEPKDGLPKGTEEERIAALEAEILSKWPRERILTPDDVRGSAPTLREAIVTNGWPTLGETRGKILFFVDKTDAWRTAYTRGDKDLDGRLMFVDSDPGASYEATYVLNDATSPEIGEAVKQGFIVRTRADSDNKQPLAGDTSTRDAALASGAQLVSTDYPAPVQGVNYVVEIPGGTPSRCNPLVAPAGCTSEDIENPAFLQ
jgi:Phosphoinositide phospholipase C, Ca2+-dependent